jgi:hypothetical protein
VFERPDDGRDGTINEREERDRDDTIDHRLEHLGTLSRGVAMVDDSLNHGPAFQRRADAGTIWAAGAAGTFAADVASWCGSMTSRCTTHAPRRRRPTQP